MASWKLAQRCNACAAIADANEQYLRRLLPFEKKLYVAPPGVVEGIAGNL